MAARVVCVGIAVLDRIHAVAQLPVGPGKHFAHSLTEAGGGPAATAAVTVARLGGEAALWSRVGDDRAGETILAELAAYGVATDAVRRCPGARSSTASIAVEPGGERQIVTYVDPALDPDPAWLPLDALGAAGCLLADLRWPEGSQRALRAASARGLPAVLDADVAPDPAAVRPLLALASHVVFSEPGLRQATGAADPADGLARARALAPGILAVTLGERGALVFGDYGPQHIPAFPIAAVDTTGAGDVFHGALALALAEGQALGPGLRFAAAAAALKCIRPGGRAGIPDRRAVAQFLEEQTA